MKKLRDLCKEYAEWNLLILMMLMLFHFTLMIHFLYVILAPLIINEYVVKTMDLKVKITQAYFSIFLLLQIYMVLFMEGINLMITIPTIIINIFMMYMIMIKGEKFLW